MGNPWTADYLKITGELDVDLRSNIAAEARAKIVYERLINFCRDPGTKDALQFLMTREITHMKAFAAALESMGLPPFTIGQIAPTPGLVDQYINASTGEGDMGEVDARGPWNQEPILRQIRSPALPPATDGELEDELDVQSGNPGSEELKELLVEQLRDLLHAEKQLLKAIPKMAKASRSEQLSTLFENHLAETEVQVERLNESLKLLGVAARAKPCKGMAGLVEEGEEVMSDGKSKEDLSADLGLIGAALRVEHYEIAGYTTARNLALQLQQSQIVHLLTQSLGEKCNAGQLLDQVAQPMMSLAKAPERIK